MSELAKAAAAVGGVLCIVCGIALALVTGLDWRWGLLALLLIGLGIFLLTRTGGGATKTDTPVQNGQRARRKEK